VRPPRSTQGLPLLVHHVRKGPTAFGAMASESEGKRKEGDEAGEASPWAVAPHCEDPRDRVVGWRAGLSLASKDVQEILRKERRARHEYQGLQKAATSRTKSQESMDPLSGLPPTWQAFWSTVPHLDPQAAYRQFRKDQQRQVKSQEKSKLASTLPPGTDEDMDDVEEETRRLDEEVRRKRQVLAEKEKLCREWDDKLARVRSLDRDEGELSRRTVRKLESASYEYGIMEGKMRSSDIYFALLFEDAKIAHAKKVATLQRSYALMEKQIDMLKGEVRMLLKTAAETQSVSDPLQTSEKKRSAESSEGKAPTTEPLLGHRHVALEAAPSPTPSLQNAML